MGGVITIALGIVLGGVMLALLAVAVVYWRVTLSVTLIVVGIAVLAFVLGAAALGYWHSRTAGWDAWAIAGVTPLGLVLSAIIVLGLMLDYHERKTAATAAGKVPSRATLLWEVLTEPPLKREPPLKGEQSDSASDADDGSEDGSEDPLLVGLEGPVLDINSEMKAFARQLTDVADEVFKPGGERAAQMDRLTELSELLLLAWLVRNGLVEASLSQGAGDEL
jgi:hypothetical protein